MSVRLDSTGFKQRMVKLRTAWTKTNVGQSIADTSARDIAEQMLFKFRHTANTNYRFDTQVGITQDKFNTAISGVDRIGDAHFGILNIRSMGDERDIAKIFGIKGLWHSGQGNSIGKSGLSGFDSFKVRILGNPANRANLANLRAPYWGHKVPQWIYLEYGDDGSESGNITPPGSALQYTKVPKYVFDRWRKFVRAQLRVQRI